MCFVSYNDKYPEEYVLAESVEQPIFATRNGSIRFDNTIPLLFRLAWSSLFNTTLNLFVGISVPIPKNPPWFTQLLSPLEDKYTIVLAFSDVSFKDR